MTRKLTTRQQAFDLLRIASQHSHIKLHDLAEYVIDTGTLPDESIPGWTQRSTSQ
jgi:hypothetical protein